MTGFQIIALLVSVTALFGYLNFRFFRLPMTIGVMALSLVATTSTGTGTTGGAGCGSETD